MEKNKAGAKHRCTAGILNHRHVTEATVEEGTVFLRLQLKDNTELDSLHTRVCLDQRALQIDSFPRGSEVSLARSDECHRQIHEGVDRLHRGHVKLLSPSPQSSLWLCPPVL
ncbi:hypothetical protein VZT92_006828 [Zoarces viviparus]|uniref:Uncharacterized protein n=1 Tax=Zoarces viviparus TaxID=48416 RepID=A0AAW1FQ58_ZOAVI